MKSPVHGIRRVGFRRWYERQLVQSHVWLVVCVLALVMVAAGFELLTLEAGWRDFAFDATLIVAGLGLAWISWMRYAHMMMTAEFVGAQANCPACAHYGFRSDKAERSERTLGATCPKCGHRWLIEPPA